MKRALPLLAWALASASSALAHDANGVHRFVLGKGSALAASEALNAAGTLRSSTTFPKAPRIASRARLTNGIGQAPASDAAGNLYIAHGEPRVSKLDPSGRALWSERLPSEAAAAPALLANGRLLIVTREAEALVYAANGVLLERRPLPLAELRRRFLLVPTTNAGALVANGNEVLELDDRAQVVRRAKARAPLSALLESDSGWLAVSETGSVERARQTGDLELVAELGGSVADGAAVQDGRLLALVDGHRFVSLDLRSGAVSPLANEPTLNLSGPLAAFAKGGAAFVIDGGFVSTRAADGSETLRVAVGAGAGFEPAMRGLRPALLVADARGALTATRSGNDAIVLASDGSTTRLDGSACLDPFRATPVPSGLVLACRSGQLFFVSDTAP